MTTPICFAAPKPYIGQRTTLAQQLHEMVVDEEFKSTTHLTCWSLNTPQSVPFDIWQPLPARHNFHTKYSPAVRYGYNRVHTSSLFSPQDEVVESSRERLVLQPIGPHTPEPVPAPSIYSNPRFSNLTETTPPHLKVKRIKHRSVLFHHKVSWKHRSLRGSQRLSITDDRHRLYTSMTYQTHIVRH